MKDTLRPGVQHTTTFEVTDRHTVPKLLPDAPGFAEMPEVLATGYMVGILEWACVEAVVPYLDETEQTLGTQVNFSHEAPTLPGSTITIDVTVTKVEGRALEFEVEARDENGIISRGTHQRGVINRERFADRMAKLGVKS